MRTKEIRVYVYYFLEVGIPNVCTFYAIRIKKWNQQEIVPNEKSG